MTLNVHAHFTFPCTVRTTPNYFEPLRRVFQVKDLPITLIHKTLQPVDDLRPHRTPPKSETLGATLTR